MRCSSYCVAESYDALGQNFNSDKFNYKYQIIDKVLHLQYLNKTNQKDIDIFVFNFGSCIIWNAQDENEELEILKNLESCQSNALQEMHSEFIDFNYNDHEDRTYIDEEKNIIYLANTEILIKLSVSHALAQAVKLNVLEESVIKLLENTKPIQQELSEKGRVSLSKSEISKQIGVLFSSRYSVNMHSDVLDTPEFFWRRPRYEPVYLMTVEFQDIRTRQEILNNHLNLIQELYNMLSSDLDHKQSSRLEMVIIILIAIEIVIALYKEGFLEKLISLLF